MINYGTYHPWSFEKTVRALSPGMVYYLDKIDFVITGEISTAALINANTGASTSLTVTPYSYEINGMTVESARVTGSLSTGIRYYINFDSGSAYAGFIEKAPCQTVIKTNNSCNNSQHAWEDDGADIDVQIYNAVEGIPTFASRRVTRITDKGEEQVATLLVKRNVLEAVLPIGFANILNGIADNDDNSLDGDRIKNIEVASEIIGIGNYARFTISFEFDNLSRGSGCCEELDLDDISDPGSTPGGEECADFTVEIEENNGNLSVVLNDEPEGTPIYRWFRNGQFLSNATNINVSQPGEYRVLVIIGVCRASANYFIDDLCAAFRIELYSVGNDINANFFNIPGEESDIMEISVVLNGEEVGTELPYTIEESGTYYVYVEINDCRKSAGIVMQLQDEDCDFTIGIQRDGNELTAETDLDEPVLQWYFENEAGKVPIASTETLTMNLPGIYWLEIVNGECNKEEYVYYGGEDSCMPIKICNWEEMLPINRRQDRFINVSGDSFTAIEIDLDRITNPENQLIVHRNGNVLQYVAGSPSDIDEYTIVSGDYVVWSSFPLANEDLIVNQI